MPSYSYAVAGSMRWLQSPPPKKNGTSSIEIGSRVGHRAPYSIGSLAVPPCRVTAILGGVKCICSISSNS